MWSLPLLYLWSQLENSSLYLGFQLASRVLQVIHTWLVTDSSPARRAWLTQVWDGGMWARGGHTARRDQTIFSQLLYHTGPGENKILKFFSTHVWGGGANILKTFSEQSSRHLRQFQVLFVLDKKLKNHHRGGMGGPPKKCPPQIFSFLWFRTPCKISYP